MIQTDYLKILDTIDLSERRIPVMTVQGAEAGAVVWIVANAHGDEITGIEVVHRVLRWLDQHGLQRGTVYAMPMLNPLGNELAERHITLEDEDLNRNYPGHPAGSLTERLAHLIYSRILNTQPDLVIDLHTMHTRRTLPFIILDRFIDHPRPDLHEQLYKVACEFGVTVVYDFPLPIYQQLGMQHSLSGSLFNRACVLAYTVELGPPRIIEETFVQAGVRGVLNSLRMFHMIDGDFEADPTFIRSDVPLRRDPLIRANYSGILDYHVKPGDYVQAGQVVAQTRNILDQTLDTITAPSTGHVIYLGGRNIVFPGAEVLALAVPET